MVAANALERESTRRRVETCFPVLIWDYLMPDGRRCAGVSSGAQLAFHMERLRHQNSTSALIRTAIVDDHDHPNDAVENTIEFLRYWANFNFPKYLMAVDRVQRAVFQKMNRAAGNYKYFGSLIENWFLDPAIMALDEYGIPIQVGQKLDPLLHPGGGLDAAIAPANLGCHETLADTI